MPDRADLHTRKAPVRREIGQKRLGVLSRLVVAGRRHQRPEGAAHVAREHLPGDERTVRP